MFTVAAAKGSFFDSASVLRQADKATVRALSRFGAFVRQRARTSIRRGAGTSDPGSPPVAHTEAIKLILFAYDRPARSVVIGPALLSGKRGDAPAALEYGGDSVLPGPRPRRVRVRARPFMGPAFEKELPNAPGLWAGGVG